MSAVMESQTFSTVKENAANQPVYTNQGHAELFAHRFSLLRERSILTDSVLISNDDKRFKVHRFVMAGASEYYFNQLLNAVEHENVTAFSLNIHSEALTTIIKFCYTGDAELTADNVGDVLWGAKTLQIDSLTLLCAKMLEETLNVGNCIRYLEIADVHQVDMLRENALAIITDVFPNVTQLPEFFNLSNQQIVSVLRKLLNDQDELFCGLLDSLNQIENLFPALKLDNDNSRSVVRASFVAGFLMSQKLTSAPPARLEPKIQQEQDDKTGSESGCGSDNLSENGFHLLSESEYESDTDFEVDEQRHVLSIFKGNTIQFKQLCDLQRKWEKSCVKIQLVHGIESFRDATMIPADKHIVMFHTRNGSISRAECLTLESVIVESIDIPRDVLCSNLELFCHMNDTIYCFSRSEQQHFFGYDLKSKSWSRGHIENVKVAKQIVGLNNELYFLGCGFDRTLVRSYHLQTKKWSERQYLHHEHKQTCFKGIVLNESIYVVMTRYDSEKIYNGTEFLIQRFDETNEDWTVVKRVYYSQYVGHFNLAVAGNCLYIFYGDGEVQIYDEDNNEWKKGPAIEHGVLDVAMCMTAVQPNALVCAKPQSFY